MQVEPESLLLAVDAAESGFLDVRQFVVPESSVDLLNFALAQQRLPALRVVLLPFGLCDIAVPPSRHALSQSLAASPRSSHGYRPVASEAGRSPYFALADPPELHTRSPRHMPGGLLNQQQQLFSQDNRQS